MEVLECRVGGQIVSFGLLSAPQPCHRLCQFPDSYAIDFLETRSSHLPQEQEVRESKGDLMWGDLPATTRSPHPDVGPQVLSRQRGEGSFMTHRVCPTLSSQRCQGVALGSPPLPFEGQAEAVWRNEGCGLWLLAPLASGLAFPGSHVPGCACPAR